MFLYKKNIFYHVLKKKRDIPYKLYAVILSSCYFELNEMEILFHNTPFLELDFPISHSFLALHFSSPFFVFLLIASEKKGGFSVTYRFPNVPAIFQLEAGVQLIIANISTYNHFIHINLHNLFIICLSIWIASNTETKSKAI